MTPEYAGTRMAWIRWCRSRARAAVVAGRGPAPKPAGQRRRSNKPAAGEWVDLPKARKGRVPKWPLGVPSYEQEQLWRRLWRTPQATMWEQSGLGTEIEVARYVLLTLEATKLEELGAEKIKGIFAEVRQVAAGLGLGPKGLQDRRWRVAEEEAEAARADQPPAMDTYRQAVSGGSVVAAYRRGREGLGSVSLHDVQPRPGGRDRECLHR